MVSHTSRELLRRVSLSAGLLACAVAGAGCAQRAAVLVAAGEPADAPRLEARLRAEVRAGPVRGHVQTPIGGQPGTTSLGRPTFDELDVSTGFAPSADLRFAYRRHRLHIGATWWVLHGTDALRQDLVTHGDTYLAGTLLDSNTEMLNHWLGYGYAFDLSRRPGVLTFTPGVGLLGNLQTYEVAGAGRSSSRDFTSYAPMLDAQATWYPGGRIHLSGEFRLVLEEALGLSSPTTAVDAALRFHLDLWRDASLHLGAGVSSYEHRDEQTVPNDARMVVLPWFGLGAELKL